VTKGSENILFQILRRDSLLREMMKQVGKTSTLAPVQVAKEAVTIKKLLSDLI
jgi:hypothetical protein